MKKEISDRKAPESPLRGDEHCEDLVTKPAHKVSHTEGRKGGNSTSQRLAPPDVFEPPIRQPISVKGGEEVTVSKEVLTRSLLDEAADGCAIYLTVAEVLKFLAKAKAYPMDQRSREAFSKWITKNLNDKVIEPTSTSSVSCFTLHFVVWEKKPGGEDKARIVGNFKVLNQLTK